MAEPTHQRAGRKRFRRQRLIALTVLGVLSLNYPLLAVFADESLFLGIPVFYLYLFLAWGVFILLCALILAGRTPSQLPDRVRNRGEENG